MTKVELIVEAVYIKRVIELLANDGVEHYTIIEDIKGCGTHGLRSADDVTEISGNVYFFTLITDEKFNEIEKDIANFIKRFGGKCFISDVSVLEHE